MAKFCKKLKYLTPKTKCISHVSVECSKKKTRGRKHEAIQDRRVGAWHVVRKAEGTSPMQGLGEFHGSPSLWPTWDAADPATKRRLGHQDGVPPYHHYLRVRRCHPYCQLPGYNTTTVHRPKCALYLGSGLRCWKKLRNKKPLRLLVSRTAQPSPHFFLPSFPVRIWLEL